MVYCFEDFELDSAARELRRGREVIHLQRQVFEVLKLLVVNVGRAVPKMEILDEVWSGQFVSESALTSRIKSARRAVGDDGRAQRLIKNVHGVGYRFVGEVTEKASAERDSAPATDDAPSERNGGDTAHRDLAARPDIALTISVDDEFPFVGREEEVGLLSRLMNDDQGRPGVGLVGGEPGVGKSRLVVEMAEQAASARGAVVGAGRCDEQVATPLQPWRDVVHQLAAANSEAFERWSAGLPVVQALLDPGHSPRALVSTDQTPAGRAWDVQVATDGIVSLIGRAAAEQPVVVIIDDIQWSDEPTRTAMTIITRRLATRPVYLLASFRTSPADLPDGVAQWLANWGRGPRVERVDLEGLGAEAVSELALRVLGSSSHASTANLHAQTNGHSLFVTELIREVERGADGRGLPDSVKALVEGRLARLDSNARSLVVAGAALGPEFAVEPAAVIADLEMPSAIAALDRAIRSGLVHEGSSVDRFRFSHQLMPSAVLANLTSPARAALHDRCARTLTQVGADPVEVAQHVILSVPLTNMRDAIDQGRRAASDAHQRLHFDKAIRLLTRVGGLDLEARTRCEVELDLGEIMNDAGQGTEAVEVFDSAARRARDHDWPDLIVRAAFGRGGRSPYRRFLDRGTLTLLEEVQTLGTLDALTQARAQARTAAFQLNWQRYSDREATSADALAAGRKEGAAGRELLELLEARWVAVGCPRGAGLIDEIDHELRALRDELGVVGADAGMVETAALWFARGDDLRVEAAHYLMPPGSRRNIDFWRYEGLNATVAAIEGRFDEAAERYDEAGLRGPMCWGDSGPVLQGLAHLFLDAMSGSMRAEPILARAASHFPSQILLACHAWSLVLADRKGEAEVVMSKVSPEAVPLFPEHLVGGNGLMALAEASIALGRSDLALAAEKELETVEDLVLGVPWAPSFAAAHGLSRLAAFRGDAEASGKWRRRADEKYDALGAPAMKDFAPL